MMSFLQHFQMRRNQQVLQTSLQQKQPLTKRHLRQIAKIAQAKRHTIWITRQIRRLAFYMDMRVCQMGIHTKPLLI